MTCDQGKLKFIAIIALVVSRCNAGDIPSRDGDIAFQRFPSPQCRAIQLATESQFSHVGMILMYNGALMVYETIGPVKFTPIDSWMARDEHHHIVVTRLRDSVCSLRCTSNSSSDFPGEPGGSQIGSA
jgi:hypothetical protein